MSIQLKLKKGESVERGLKRLKKILDKEGIIKTLRDQRYFEKPCVKARKKSARARIRSRSRRRSQELSASKRQARPTLALLPATPSGLSSEPASPVTA